jgi:predicted RNA-binding Zn-ribbon protein involved in translation (DUF1610 family)
MKRVEKEMIYSRLRYGTLFACPKCGSERFLLVWSWKLEIPDGLEFRENRAIIRTDEGLSDWDPWNPDCISHAVCPRCGNRISGDEIRKILKRTKAMDYL